jgi:hypothetical protein
MLAPHRLLPPLFVAASLAVATPVYPEVAGACRDENFFAQLHRLNDWKALHAFYKQYLPACADDGVYREGYSEVAVRILAKHWETMPQLQALAVREPAFRAFVLRHIDATADPDELNQALHNATTQCPAGAAGLCEEIVARAQSAIKDL